MEPPLLTSISLRMLSWTSSTSASRRSISDWDSPRPPWSVPGGPSCPAHIVSHITMHAWGGQGGPKAQQVTNKARTGQANGGLH